MTARTVTFSQIFKFSGHYWRKHPVLGVTLLFSMIFSVGADAILPVYAGRMVNALAQSPAGDTTAYDIAIRALVMFFSIAIGSAILRNIAMYQWNWFGAQNLYAILTDAMAKVQRFSSEWHANSFAGATVRKITRGMWAFDVFGDTLFMGIIPVVSMMVGMCAMLLIKVPVVGLFTLGTIIFYAGVSIWMSLVILSPRFRASAGMDTKVGATLADIVTGNATVKSFAAEEREEERFEDVALTWRASAVHAWQWGQSCEMARHIMRLFLMGGMVGITIWLWRSGRAAPGDIALVISSYFIVTGYLRDIGMHVTNLQKSTSEMEDVVNFFYAAPTVMDVAGARKLQLTHTTGADLSFDDVVFRYTDAGAPIYNGLSIDIKAGEKIALVGHSGSGKSTFVKLVQRLYDVEGGRITIDGQDISKITMESLRRAVALVPQEPVLFHRSLSENIAYARPDASMEEIRDAARKAYAGMFIDVLPNGYDTLVGERGIKLSGGERQRVAIARAILADAPILILDEATSSLDSESEHYIQLALNELMRGRTTITIAHRLSTIKAADRILVFSGGSIVEEGTHSQLVARESSLYKKMYDMQAFTFAEDTV